MIDESRVLTCVYCGHEYPQDTPAHGDKVLRDHIKVCEKHPMRRAEMKILKLEYRVGDIFDRIRMWCSENNKIMDDQPLGDRWINIDKDDGFLDLLDKLEDGNV